MLILLLARRRPLYGLLVLCAGGLISCSPHQSGVRATHASAATEPLTSEEAAAMLSEVNDRRAASGLAPMELDSDLTQVAQFFAADMYVQGYFSHTSPSGQKLGDRLVGGGIQYRAAAENIAKGEMDVDAVMELWMKSEGHRGNLLDPRMKRLGVGHSGDIWVQEFAD